MILAEKIMELRKKNGWSQEELAEKMGVARRTVSRWETGANMPDMDILIDISDFYGVDLREILDGERKNKQMDKEVKDYYKLNLSDKLNDLSNKIDTISNLIDLLG